MEHATWVSTIPLVDVEIASSSLSIMYCYPMGKEQETPPHNLATSLPMATGAQATAASLPLNHMLSASKLAFQRSIPVHVHTVETLLLSLRRWSAMNVRRSVSLKSRNEHEAASLSMSFLQLQATTFFLLAVSLTHTMLPNSTWLLIHSSIMPLKFDGDLQTDQWC